MICEKVICDMCGAEKGSANHWLTLGIFLHEEETILLISSFDLEYEHGPFEIEDQAAAGIKHACGNGCLQQFIERWAATQSLEAPRSPAGEPA